MDSEYTKPAVEYVCHGGSSYLWRVGGKSSGVSFQWMKRQVFGRGLQYSCC